MECIIETNNLVQFICAYEMSSPKYKRNDDLQLLSLIQLSYSLKIEVILENKAIVAS